MNDFPATKGRRVLDALIRIGWNIKRRSGSHIRLFKYGHPDYTFSCHDSAEIGPTILKKIAKHTGLKPEDL